MSKKVIQIGTSLGITVPRDLLKRLGLKKGSYVDVGYNRRRESIEITPVQEKQENDGIINEVSAIVDKYADELKRIEDEW